MNTLEEDIDIKNIDKSDWKVYKFEKIATSIGERVEPTNTDLEIYVGLEHLDADSVHIKRFGKKGDVSGTKLRCYPGDVIFARRRAYQRKAAIVEFDGFCSAHSLVLRANPEVIEPKLFPFFLHSDTFMHRAIDISVGSLSPTINWGTLKNEDFLLPPKDQQARLAELLWAVDEMAEMDQVVVAHLENLIATMRMSLNHDHNTCLTGSEITVLITKGASPKWQGFDYCDSGTLFVTSENVLEDEIDLKERKYLPMSFNQKQKRSQLKIDDVLINIVGASIGRVAKFDIGEDNVNINQAVALFRLNKKIALPDYIVQYLLENENLKRLLNQQSETARPNLSLKNLSDYKFYLPPIEKQGQVIEKFKVIKTLILNSRKKVFSTKQLQKSLINQIF